MVDSPVAAARGQIRVRESEPPRGIEKEVAVRSVSKAIASELVGRAAAAAIGIGLLAAAAPRMARAADQVPPAAMQEAQDIYKTRCTMCHGPSGKGDGPAGAALNPKPRDLGDQAWQKSVADEHIEKIILSGGAAVGKSPLMPASPDLSAKPDVIRALRVMVRNFGTQK
jgi:mono/diheme cytochrome c family protein